MHVSFEPVKVSDHILTIHLVDGKSYPFPSPDWLTSNASWAAEQLEVYYTDRRGTLQILHTLKHKAFDMGDF